MAISQSATLGSAGRQGVAGRKCSRDCCVQHAAIRTDIWNESNISIPKFTLLNTRSIYECACFLPPIYTELDSADIGIAHLTSKFSASNLQGNGVCASDWSVAAICWPLQVQETQLSTSQPYALKAGCNRPCYLLASMMQGKPCKMHAQPG